MLSRRVKMGLGGAGLLTLGIWCPDVEYAFGLGSRSFWYEGMAVAFVLFGVALYGALGVIVNSRKTVRTAGGGALVGIAALYLHRKGEISSPFALTHMSWGWGVLVAGALLLLVSGLLPINTPRQ
jgi:hypothetical protein